MLESLKFVDAVILCQAPGPQEILRKWTPDIYARNDEYLAQDRPEYEVCRELGIEVVFTKTVPPHTSDIIERLRRYV